MNKRATLLDENTGLKTSDHQIQEFRKAAATVIAHCRDYPAAKGKRTLTVVWDFVPAAADPDDQVLQTVVKVKLPAIKSPEISCRSSGRNQTRFDFAAFEDDSDND